MYDGGNYGSLTSKQDRLSQYHLGNIHDQKTRLARTGQAFLQSGTPRVFDRHQRGENARSSGQQVDYSRYAHLDTNAQEREEQIQVAKSINAKNVSNRFDPRMKGNVSAKTATGFDVLMDGLRRRIREKGLGSAMALEQFYRSLDADGSGSLSYEEFQHGLMENGLLLSEGECELMFSYFDEDRTGQMHFNEFLEAVRGQLSEKRRAVVHEAFAKLDVNGDGTLSLEDIDSKYLSFAHPDVRSGLKSEEEVFQEFLDCFDTVNRDGNVTLSEFERYYEYTSAVVADDEMFVANVRNAWGLPGATGGACLRVRVTHHPQEGRLQLNIMPITPSTQRRHGQTLGRGPSCTKQDLVEIRPAVPLHPNDPRFLPKVKERLEEMGFEGVSRIEVVSRD